MLNKHEIKNKYKPIDEDNFIRNLSHILPPIYPPKIEPAPNIIKHIPALKLFYFLSSVVGIKCSIVPVDTPIFIPSRTIKPRVNFIIG